MVVTLYMQLYTDKCIPQVEKIASVTFLLLLLLITQPRGQPHTVFGGFISISGGWILSCKEPIKAEDSLHITFESSLGVFASVSGGSESESKYTCKV